MAAYELPSPGLLRQLFRYEPETGRLFWRERTVDHFPFTEPANRATQCRLWNNRWAGKEAGSFDQFGYRTVKLTIGPVKAKHIRGHRICWCLVYGQWPENEIDHIDGDRANNRIENLRDVSREENGRNRYTGGKGIYPIGVRPSSHGNHWKAVYWLDGKTRFLGCFKTMEAAAEAARSKRLELGYSERHYSKASKS